MPTRTGHLAAPPRWCPAQRPPITLPPLSPPTPVSPPPENVFAPPPAGCAPRCSTSDLAAGTQTACNPATNTYPQEVIVTFANPPASGNLVVNGQSFAIGTSPQTVTLTGLTANGANVNVTASFSANTQCSRTVNALFMAPARCREGEAPDCSAAAA